jgi:uncharacterized protein YjaZ
MKIICCIFIFITLLSCQRQDADFERTVITVNNQKFEILTANKIIDGFISRRLNYSRNVYRHIEQEFKDCAEFPFLIETLKAKIEPDRKLEEEMDIFRTIDFEHIVESTFRSVVDELPGPDTKILFFPSNPAYKEILESYGVALHAVTPGAGKIIVTINPTIENWQGLLPYALAHEYHHSVWIWRNFERSDLTLLEYLLLEGRADAFAFELFPNRHHPFINALNEEQEKRIWKSIKPELHIRDSELNDKIMSGTKDIPTGSGYSIGFSIIKSFKAKNPQIGDKELIDMTPNQILLLSKYDE